MANWNEVAEGWNSGDRRYPSLTVPAGLVNGLPVGIALATGPNQDGLLLQVARAYERAANARVPPNLII